MKLPPGVFFSTMLSIHRLATSSSTSRWAVNRAYELHVILGQKLHRYYFCAFPYSRGGDVFWDCFTDWSHELHPLFGEQAIWIWRFSF